MAPLVVTPRNIIVITGMSGAGKSTAIRGLEDAGWFCIDNLPAPLLMKVAELGGAHERLAFGIDVREGEFLKEAPKAIDEARRAGHQVEVLFLDSSDESLTRRYSETRRRHPLSGSGGVGEGLARERAALTELREQAHHLIDSTQLTVHELRKQVMARFGGDAQLQMAVTVLSFGFKYGVPPNVDLVFDVRYLPNPFFVPELKALTGKDAAVASYVLERPDSIEFMTRLTDMLGFLLPRYQAEGKTYLTVAIGCTGGKHRSVAIAAALADRLKPTPWGATVQLWHRDVGKE
jgi:RNase adapter protein RapZ